MKVNAGKTKVMVFEKGEIRTECDMLIEGVISQYINKRLSPARGLPTWPGRGRSSAPTARIRLLPMHPYF
ncbi:hypothetical protein EVAR_89858_1 [Eumeta japonica]|uniref:Uncharacterized protein n=1 Tax=Eumeta variegata TaxID=151549 RepID=A0A4C1ZV75_EUMVA|nr:hypothetical protein EVAR_89858_1 [Eumeta japonica]